MENLRLPDGGGDNTSSLPQAAGRGRGRGVGRAITGNHSASSDAAAAAAGAAGFAANNPAVAAAPAVDAAASSYTSPAEDDDPGVVDGLGFVVVRESWCVYVCVILCGL